jgi:hypothetical protein
MIAEGAEAVMGDLLDGGGIRSRAMPSVILDTEISIRLWPPRAQA